MTAQSEYRFRFVNTHINGSPSGEYVVATLEKFIPGTAYDVATKREVAVRRRVVGRSANGEAIYPVIRVPLCEFVDRFMPDPTWMTASEWNSIKAQLAPLIEREKGIVRAETDASAAASRQANDAHRHALNPGAAMSEAIAHGIAAALAQLNASPKSRKD